MRFDGGEDERYMALLNKGAMVVGEGGLYNAGGVDIVVILRMKSLSGLVKELVESTGVAFEVGSSGRVAPTAVGRKFIRLINSNIGIDDKVYVLEPYSALFKEVVNLAHVYVLLECMRLSDGSVEVAKDLNYYVDHVRERGRGSRFRARLNSYHRSANKNYRELIKYEQRLFECYSRLLVVRLDLSYKKEFCRVQQGVALQHRKWLFDNARSNKIFEHMVGYVTKLEHGMGKGFHFHCVFFFDGAKVREDITLARRIGEYWETVVTRGEGGYYNCNYAKEKYRQCGIGMVAHSNMEKREGLRLALVYLTKTDLYMKLKAEGRALTKGVMSGAPSGRGRPRAVVLPE